MKLPHPDIASRTRMLCAVCMDLKLVTKIKEDQNSITLECGHKRKHLLPVSAPGRISLEHMGTKDGLRLFPEEKRI